MVVKREAMEPWMTYEGPAKRPGARHKHPAASEAHMRPHKTASKMQAAKTAKAASKMRGAETTKTAEHPSKAAAKAMHSPKATTKATSGSRILRR